ncbi:hypothetical protein ANN_03855 [Periplaneta americana]|uniref:Uncharacterized protein n=1 Tax=Periplaneta americana TaxID=6978 RepID=A0ABQ8U4V0_PERAM|nr:hypothetical protein ANN_03855 [Periplaneta americana]
MVIAYNGADMMEMGERETRDFGRESNKETACEIDATAWKKGNDESGNRIASVKSCDCASEVAIRVRGEVRVVIYLRAIKARYSIHRKLVRIKTRQKTRKRTAPRFTQPPIKLSTGSFPGVKGGQSVVPHHAEMGAITILVMVCLVSGVVLQNAPSYHHERPSKEQLAKWEASLGFIGLGERISTSTTEDPELENVVDPSLEADMQSLGDLRSDVRYDDRDRVHRLIFS